MPAHCFAKIITNSIVRKVYSKIWILTFPVEPAICIPNAGKRGVRGSHLFYSSAVFQFIPYGLIMFLYFALHPNVHQAILIIADRPVFRMLYLLVDNNSSNNE